MPDGNWRHNRIFEDVSVALDNRMSVSEFWDLSEEDQAFMIAHKRATGTIEAYERFLSEKNRKK